MSTPFRFKNADNTTVDFEDYYVRADYFRSGNLWLWGQGPDGGLGDNTILSKSSPVQTIAWGSNWIDVSSGYQATMAIRSDGTLWVWGRGTQGQIGDNTIVSKSSPVQTITFGTNWKQAFANERAFSGGIKTDGTLWMWGDNSTGGLGDNTITHRSSPVQTVAFGTNWKQVCGSSLTGNQFAVATKTDGTLWCWGFNTSGQLGDNTIIKKSSPVQTVAFGTNWKQVDCGAAHTAAIKTDSTLWSWGLNTSGQLGDNTRTSRSSPVQTIAGGTNWKQVACGSSHTAAIKTDGTLWTWGNNYQGQLGHNTSSTQPRSSPVQTIAYGTNWKQVSGGTNHTAAIKTDGTLWCWGLNTSGQLGDNTTVKQSSPVQTIAGGTNWKKVDCGLTHTAAIKYQDDYQ